MQLTSVSDETLGYMYGTLVLPNFNFSPKGVEWLQFRLLIGPDNELHLFRSGHRSYVLLYEDYPSKNAQNVAKEIMVPLGAVKQIELLQPNEDNNHIYSLHIESANRHVHNVTGYFQLFEITEPSVVMARKSARVRNKKMLVVQSLVSIANELIDCEKSFPKARENLGHIAYDNYVISRAEGFGDLADWFYDFSEYIDIYDTYDHEEDGKYWPGSKKLLDEIIAEFRFASDITTAESRLLDENILPIHEKMVENPDQSPSYFVEMIRDLDKLVANGQLSISSAVVEAMYATARPQIQNAVALRPAIAQLYEISKPGEIIRGDDLRRWNRVAKIVRKYGETIK